MDDAVRVIDRAWAEGGIVSITVITRVLLALTLISTAIVKFVDSKAFQRFLVFLLPGLKSWGRLVALFLSTLESLLAISLVTGYRLEVATATTFIVLIIGFGMALLAYRRGFEGGCGCFGSWDSSSVHGLVFLRTGVLAVACAGPALASTIYSGSIAPIWHFSAGSILAAFVVSVGLAAVYALISELWTHLSGVRGRGMGT